MKSLNSIPFLSKWSISLLYFDKKRLKSKFEPDQREWNKIFSHEQRRTGGSSATQEKIAHIWLATDFVYVTASAKSISEILLFFFSYK